MSQIPQQAHDFTGRRVVGGRVGGEEGRIRAAAGRRAQWHARPHTEFPGLVGGAGDDLARFAGITAAADDDGQPGQFGATAQLDRRQELVEVHVQDPVACRRGHADVHLPQSLRAKLSHASPNVRRV
ncbi:hypothetical protein MINTM003_38270 [Mycobacterium paraintracellulare]|nr:hypothetical protein MINTM003_38270 [Mycobacterium paraintracellulare]BCO90654.1 hypothetical protein MINTM015_39110 [Mycobacterium paraintracellulare]